MRSYVWEPMIKMEDPKEMALPSRVIAGELGTSVVASSRMILVLMVIGWLTM